METADRKILTFKGVKKDLLKKFCVSALFRLPETLLFIFAICLFRYALFSVYNSYSSGHNWLAGVVVFVLAVMLVYVLFGFGYNIYKLVVAFVKAFTVLTLRFRIVEDILINSDSKEYNPFKRHATFLKRRSHQYKDGYEEVMYFSQYGRLVLDGFECVSEDYGDEFYLAVFGKKNRVLKAYSAKEYEIIK